jgi:hypothetical protein
MSTDISKIKVIIANIELVKELLDEADDYVDDLLYNKSLSWIDLCGTAKEIEVARFELASTADRMRELMSSVEPTEEEA